MKITIFHNPRCSKSCQTLQLLVENELEANIIEYLSEPPSRDTLELVLSYLNMQPRELMRKNESVYKELNLGDSSHSQEDLITAMLENPILIERPIVIVDDEKVALGRPPENVLQIIKS